MATIERLERLPTPLEFAELVLKQRDAAAQLLEEAKQAGNRKAVRGFEAHLRGVDKLISKYGLHRYKTIN
jgi:hypothetical protein